MKTWKSKAELRGEALKLLDQHGKVTAPYAAHLLGLHHHTVLNYVKKGYLQALVISNVTWILKDEIERFREHGKLNPKLNSEPEPEPEQTETP